MTMPRSRFATALAGGLALPLALVLGGCSKIEVKRDSPEATAATLIKIYGEKKYELLQQVVDPMAVRAEKRDQKCFDVLLAYNQWTTEMLENFSRTMANQGLGQRFTKPKPDVEGCVCGPNGNAAADAAGAFTSSDLHASIEFANVDPKRCSITQKTELVGKARDAISGWERTACNDVPKDAHLSLVTLKCGNDAPVGMVMRQTSDGWRLNRLDNESSTALGFGAHVEKSEAAAKKARGNLNKDLK